MADTVPFGQRLSELLTARKPDGGGQAWLAKRAGIEASTVSRWLRNERLPSLDTLEVVAPVLELSVEELVDGTNVSERSRSGPEFVPIAQYQQAVATLLDFERKSNEAEARLRDAQVSLAEERAARKEVRSELQELQDRLERETSANSSLQAEVERYRKALEKAVADIWTLNAHLADIEHVAKASAKSGRTTAVLAAIAAITGTATVAHYIGKNQATNPRAPKAKKP